MKLHRLISLLLSFMLLFSLCSVSAWAEGDTAYVTKDKELLIRKTESGAGLPNNSWPVRGRALDRVTEYSYDEFGNVTEERTSLVNPSMADFLWNLENSGQGTSAPADTESLVLDTRRTVNGYGIMKQYDFEDGMLTHERTFVKDYDDTIDEAKYTYYENGQLKSSESFSYMDSMFFWEYDVPGQRLYEFDENGFCTHWYNVEEDGMGETDVTYTYDADGKLSSLSLRVNGGEPQTMTPVYENGVQVATIHVAPDGGQVEQRFGYDDEGRVILIEYDAAEPHTPEDLFYVDGYAGEIRYNEYKAGDQHITIALTYNDQGFVKDAEWRTNGNYVAWTQYEYPVDEDGDIGYSYTDNGYGPSLWGGSNNSTYWRNDKVYKTRAGNPQSEKNYSLEILGNNLRYVRTDTSYEYETRGISVPVESTPAAQTQPGELRVEDFYPALRESYLGTPVPTPDGSKRLIRVEMVSFRAIPVVAELAYAADGSLAGVETYFDFASFAETCSWEQDCEFDEQGRVTYVPPMYGDLHIRYADDGQAYTIIYSSGYEKEIRLEDSRIQDWVKRGPLDYYDSDYDSDEVNEDGLLTRKVLGPDNVMEYSYHWETNLHNWETGRDDNTSLKDNYNEDIFLFDAHGYLLEHCVPHSAVFNYTYE